MTGVGFFFTFTVSQVGLSPWLDSIFENGLIVVGMGSLAVCILSGYSMGLKRLYAYGLLALVALVIGYFMGIFFAYTLIALGLTVMVMCFVLLIDFVRKCPLQGEKAIVEQRHRHPRHRRINT